jgi:PhoPQ-activated pathogenicity-related protein
MKTPRLPRRRWLRLGGTAAAAFVLLAPLFAADHARHGKTETALDRYVAQPDASFSWKKISATPEPGVTSTTLELVSQNWLTSAEVNRPEWRHWLLVVKPDQLDHATALLYLSGGSNQPGNPPRPSRALVEIARATHSVVLELRMVPNQPLVFHHDGVARQEDNLIAYTWDQFLRTGDARWPARLPMTKAAVRAMDAATEFLASDDGGRATIDRFVVAGQSKRGWTTWTTAAVDERVVGLCPMVIDVLNVETSIAHHFRAYGFFAPAVGDYVRQHILDWSGTPEARALYAIEDPFSYRDRFTMPKLILNDTGDQFFTPDSSQFYFDQLPGVKYLRYVPNTDHSLRNSDAFQTLGAWQFALVNHTPLPQFSWKHGADGRLTVTTQTPPARVLLWQATNPAARDFRLEKIGPIWKSSPLAGVDGVYTARVAPPEDGWTAYLVELTFEIGAGVPLKLTTDVTVTPDTLPFPAPSLPAPKGFLQTAASAAR